MESSHRTTPGHGASTLSDSRVACVLPLSTQIYRASRSPASASSCSDSAIWSRPHWTPRFAPNTSHGKARPQLRWRGDLESSLKLPLGSATVVFVVEILAFALSGVGTWDHCLIGWAKMDGRRDPAQMLVQVQPQVWVLSQSWASCILFFQINGPSTPPASCSSHEPNLELLAKISCEQERLGGFLGLVDLVVGVWE